MQLTRTGGWYDDDTYTKLLDMRQSCFIRKLQNRRKSLGSARIVLCRKDGAGKGTIPTEHSLKGGTIPAKHAAKADYLSLWRGNLKGENMKRILILALIVFAAGCSSSKNAGGGSGTSMQGTWTVSGTGNFGSQSVSGYLPGRIGF